MEKKGLPQLNHYGFFESVNQIKDTFSKSTNTERFIIRCSSKETGDIKRLIDADVAEICSFAETLPGGFEKWNVEVKEFVNTIASGTIIVEPSGRTMIETWEGPHYLNTTNVEKYHAEFDPDKYHTYFKWGQKEQPTNVPEIKEYALKALRYFFPHLKPRINEPVYVEYGVRPNGQVYFIEANDSPLLTGKE